MKPFHIALFIASMIGTVSQTHAHGHSPSRFEKYVLAEMFEFEFEITNGFKQNTCFNITVNDEINSGLKTCLSPNQRKKLRVLLSSPPNEKKHTVVCSISERKGINTRMCSDVVTFYPAELLSKK